MIAALPLPLTHHRVRALWELTKPRVTGLVVLTTWVGFHLGQRHPAGDAPDAWRLAATLVGTALASGGAAALNQYLERDVDALMRRTAQRPLPSGRLAPEDALAWGVLLISGGLLLLLLAASPLAGLLAALTVASYVFWYTPLKRRSALCTLVGGIPGALPPVIGWAAACGTVGLEAWLLFALMFLWQLPHFLAIAWLYRDEYAAAGLPMLSVVDAGGAATGRQSLLYALALLPVSLLPMACGLAGRTYLAVAVMLGVAFAAAALLLMLHPERTAARRLFLASLLYLPVVLTALALGRARL